MTFPQGKKTYAELDSHERWLWHSENYAWKYLTTDDKPKPGAVPTDPNGEWFNRDMIDAQIARLRQSRKRKPNDTAASYEAERLGRAICNDFAKARGFPNFDAAFRAGKLTYADVCRSVLANGGGLQRMPEAPDQEVEAAE